MNIIFKLIRRTTTVRNYIIDASVIKPQFLYEREKFYYPMESSFKRYFSSASSQRCWNCDKETSSIDHFCSNCKVIQPLDESASYFNILGLHKKFSIDTNELAKKYRQLQGWFHPDRFAQKSEKEKEFSSMHSSSVNKAYRTLLHPVSRAEYMLEIAGKPLQEDQITLDQTFLLSIMDINEKLMDVSNKDQLDELSKENIIQRNSLIREAEEAFDADDIDLARLAVAKLKYYDNIYNKVIEYERSHGIVD